MKIQHVIEFWPDERGEISRSDLHAVVMEATEVISNALAHIEFERADELRALLEQCEDLTLPE